MNITTVDQAEDFVSANRAAIFADQVPVNAVTGGVALGIGATRYRAACKVLGIRTRRGLIGPVRKLMAKCPDFDPAVAATPETIAEFKKQRKI